MPQVISASRRTDIPAFYSDWFVNRLREGSVVVLQPYSGKPSKILLNARDVSGIVFWSKNYAPLLSKLDQIEGTTKNLFFHFTITANRELEPGVPDYREAIRDYLFVAKRYGPEQILWRYDPLCITDTLSFDRHEERFTRCAELLRGHAKKCIISFVHPYKKVLTNLRKYADHTLSDLSIEQKREYAHRLAVRAEACGISLHACCNDYLLSEEIRKASCIEGNHLSEIFKTSIDTRLAPTRKECACTKSVDIGAYDTCAHGCLYCYANADRERAKSSLFRHDPLWNSLSEQVDEVKKELPEEQQILFP